MLEDNIMANHLTPQPNESDLMSGNTATTDDLKDPDNPEYHDESFVCGYCGVSVYDPIYHEDDCILCKNCHDKKFHVNCEECNFAAAYLKLLKKAYDMSIPLSDIGYVDQQMSIQSFFVDDMCCFECSGHLCWNFNPSDYSVSREQLEKLIQDKQSSKS